MFPVLFLELRGRVISCIKSQFGGNSKMDTSSTLIFLSHSSQDAWFAQALEAEITSVFQPNVRVFAYSRPDAIPSGSLWMDKIITNLEQADAFVILITRPAENSVWVGFELGYYSKKSNRERIYALNHLTATIPSPLDTWQAKLVIDPRQLQDFFQSLSTDLHVNYSANPNVEYLAELASQLSVRPPERSLANFARLLDTSSWDKIHVEGCDTWICADDVLFQIVSSNENTGSEPYEEDWVEQFPSKPPARLYEVNLKVAGLTIEQFFFVTLDSARYFVPMPEIEWTNNSGVRKFIWRRSSLIFKVAKIVGIFNPFRYPTIEDFAVAAGIEIVD